MTITAPAPGPTQPEPMRDPEPVVVPQAAEASEPTGRPVAPPPPSSPAKLVGAWLALMVVGITVVLLGLSPAVEQRDQRYLLSSYQAQIESASNEAYGLPGIQAPTEAPGPGTPVGVLDAERTGLHSVTVEGTDPAQTRQGPGHVVGTAGPGQPGNSAILARSHLYGSPFDSVGDMVDGDRILVTTVQGQSSYTVRYVGRRQVTDAAPAAAAGPATTAAPPSTAAPAQGDAAKDGAAAAAPPILPDGPLTPAQLYGPTEDDRLTLVTSDSANPWATGEAVVVVARMDGKPFPPTPQGGRTAAGDGRHGDPGIFAPLLLAGLLALAGVVMAVWLHRHLPWRSAYLLSAPLLVAATILVAEQVAATMPAWT